MDDCTLSDNMRCSSYTSYFKIFNVDVVYFNALVKEDVMKIWKFNVDGNQPLTLPSGSKILSAGAQGQGTFIWALVYSGAPLVERRVVVYPTGWELSPTEQDYDFIGTVAFAEGMLMYHVFAEKETS